MSAQSKPSIVFFHGLWADGSCFSSSHVPMLSHPDLVLDVIRTAANAVQGSAAAGAL
jgi:hypothetical protein